jgi:hypothetical protein
MLSNSKRNKAEKYLNKLNSSLILSDVFAYIPIKRAYQIIKMNKKLSKSLNINIGDCYLDKKYQEIIIKSKGAINSIFQESFNLYQSSDQQNKNDLSFQKLITNIIKYLKYLYMKKELKTIVVVIDGNIYNSWMYFTFIIEVIRNLKEGLTIKLKNHINYKYYELIKDALQNLDEIKSVSLYEFRTNEKNEKFIQNYFKYCDWTKVKCLNFRESQVNFKSNDIPKILIPSNANFRKIIIDNRNVFNLNNLYHLISTHGNHIEYFKIYYFTDKYFYAKGKNKLEKDIFQKLTKATKIKFMKINHLLFFTFLLLFKKSLSTIKVLVLDNIYESSKENIMYIEEHFNDIVKLITKLCNLEKLEINFNHTSNIINTFKILSCLIYVNPNLKDLKITIPSQKLSNTDNKSKEDKSKNYMEKFTSYKSAYKNEENSSDELTEFTDLIKAISSLKKLSNLRFNIDMNDNFTKIFNSYFNVGENLNNLYINHTRSLDLVNLFDLHPNLNKINFTLLDNKDYIAEKYQYEFPQRTWKSIILNNYPLNSSFVNSLIKSNNSLSQLTLNNSYNISEKSDIEIYNILLDIKAKINN